MKIMNPQEYLSKVEPVVMALFDALDKARLRAEAERRVLGPEFHYHKFLFESWSQIEDYDEPQRLNYAYSKFYGAWQALLLVNTASAAAAGAILQVAKQCISMAWPKEKPPTKGRKVGSQTISAVIWHARNQSLHFEEGVPENKATKKSIELLSSEFGINISQLKEHPRSLATEIVAIVGWHSYEHFAKDMIALLEEN